MTIDQSKAAVACGGTGFKAAFAHGVLSALESHGFRAAAYAGASLAAVPAALAAAGEASNAGIHIWLRALELLELPGNGMSDLALAQIKQSFPILRERLFAPDAPRLCVATTAVHTLAGTRETQGARAGTLGRRLQVYADRHDTAWADEHLTAHLWDTAATQRSHRLTTSNLDEALYASSRLLHGWQIPAEIDGLPFVDAVYTCACPALEMATLDYRDVVAVVCEPGPVYHNLFRTLVIPEMSWRSRIRIIRPSIDPKSLGIDDTVASERGLVALYDHGVDRGLRFVGEHLDLRPAPDPRWEWPQREDAVRESLGHVPDPSDAPEPPGE